MKQFLASLMFGVLTLVLLAGAAPNGAPPPHQVVERVIDSIASGLSGW